MDAKGDVQAAEDAWNKVARENETSLLKCGMLSKTTRARSLSGERQEEALAKIADALAQAEQRKRAEEVVRSLPDEQRQDRILIKVVRALAQVGQWEQA
ncbi:hypothetical protein [Reticulibacter mediterranei]|nr:hypothetical protein [Reticulibacter mediterranei]